MKKIYWRPRAVSRQALLLIAVIAAVGLFMVENLYVTRQREHYDVKIAAANLAREMMETVKTARRRLAVSNPEYEINPETDPAESGLIGVSMSEVTSISGNLTSKQTSVNPNFAGVIVDMLKEAKVKEGDVVAVGVSGSFPAINICIYAALESLNLKPVVIASGAASQWGANVPGLLWVDMEKLLYDQGLISFRAKAASIGGYEDQGLGMADEGRTVVIEAIQRNGLPLLKSESFQEAVDERMQLYRQNAGGQPIKAYINVGGGTISVGRSLGKKIFDPGLNRHPPSGIARVDGIMPRFIKQAVPVLHLVQITDLAERYKMPMPPLTMPEVGEGDVFHGEDYNRLLALIVLAVILVSLYGFIRTDIGYRLLQSGGRKKETGHPEPMV